VLGQEIRVDQPEPVPILRLVPPPVSPVGGQVRLQVRERELHVESPAAIVHEVDEIGVFLGLVEVYQLQERWQDAIACLESLRRLEPDDVVVKLSLAELLLEVHPGDQDVCRKVVRLAGSIENETPIHTSLLLYKARALRGLGLLDAARDTLTDALKRKKERSEELLRALRYERALVYVDLGQQRRACSELEKLYAEAPDYEDVAARLGL